MPCRLHGLFSASTPRWIATRPRLSASQPLTAGAQTCRGRCRHCLTEDTVPARNSPRPTAMWSGALQHAADQWRGDAEVAMAALLFAAQPSGIGELGEMSAGRPASIEMHCARSAAAPLDHRLHQPYEVRTDCRLAFTGRAILLISRSIVITLLIPLAASLQTK